MKSIVKIQAMGLEKLNNAEFANFMSRFSDLVNTTGTKEEAPETSTLGFEVADFLVFEEDRSTLTDIVSRSRISLQTEDMGSLDKERDSWVLFYSPYCVRKKDLLLLHADRLLIRFINCCILMRSATDCRISRKQRRSTVCCWI